MFVRKCLSGPECHLGVELSDFAIEAVQAAAAGVPLVDPSTLDQTTAGEPAGTQVEEQPKISYKGKCQKLKHTHHKKLQRIN